MKIWINIHTNWWYPPYSLYIPAKEARHYDDGARFTTKLTTTTKIFSSLQTWRLPKFFVKILIPLSNQHELDNNQHNKILIVVVQVNSLVKQAHGLHVFALRETNLQFCTILFMISCNLLKVFKRFHHQKIGIYVRKHIRDTAVSFLNLLSKTAK
jgi:hypothetical protein